MPQVGIHRFTAGDGQECSTHNRERDLWRRLDAKVEGVERIECGQNSRGQNDAAQSQDFDDDEPRQHDGTAYCADEALPWR